MKAREMLEVLTARGDLAKPGIELASGPWYNTSTVSCILHITPKTIREYIRNNEIIAYSHKSRFRVPSWQLYGSFIHMWVPQLIKVFGGNGWPLLDFITIARDTLDGNNYLDLLKKGQIDQVLAAARRANDRFGPQNEDEARIFAEEELIVDIQCAIHELMLKVGVKHPELAKRLGISVEEVSALFRSETVLDLRTIAAVFHVMGKRVEFTMKGKNA